jgi:hypothetical protein
VAVALNYSLLIVDSNNWIVRIVDIVVMYFDSIKQVLPEIVQSQVNLCVVVVAVQIYLEIWMSFDKNLLLR